MTIYFEIPGNAQAQGRPRAGKTKRGKVVMYDPKESREYKSYVRLIASQHRPRKLLEGQLEVFIKIYRQMPKSMTKKRKQAVMEGLHRPITKPDVTNIAKGIEDALNGIIYKDDSQIVDLHISKYYSDRPRVEVQIKELEGIL